MTKLTVKERTRYAEAEGHLRAAFGDGVQCMWEVAHPKGTRLAMLAGFALSYGGQPRYCILQVYAQGAGWEVYAAPQSLKIADTMGALKAMWQPTPTAEPVPKAACQNCDWVGPATDCGQDIPDYDERVAPGEEEPCGECPECRALCHLVEGSPEERARMAGWRPVSEWHVTMRDGRGVARHCKGEEVAETYISVPLTHADSWEAAVTRDAL